MTDQTDEAAKLPPELEQAVNAGLVPQLVMMTRALFASPMFPQLLMLGLAIVAVLGATAYEQIQLNSWNQPFYNALSARNFDAFLGQLVIFCQIAAILLVLNVAQRWLTEMARLKLRAGLVPDLVHEWLEPWRAFKLANAGPIGVNPDQRMHEDARHLTELSTDLGVGLLQSTMLLGSFVAVLWSLSSGFVFHVEGRDLAIPGYMLWAAIVYAGSASLLSYLAGRRLVAQNAARYAREADLRFSLMHVNEHVDAIALAGGEADEERRIDLRLQQVLAAMRRLVSSLTSLTWVTAGYGWFTIIAPILVAAPVYFSGNLSFGGLMMAIGAFNQVQTSLRWFVDNFSTIADWRATLLRVASFRAAVVASDSLHQAERRVNFENGPPGKLILEDVEVASAAGCARLAETPVEISAGERVVIVGEPGSSHQLLFKTLAGLWPWGSGSVRWPKNERLVTVPRDPYLPDDTLRDVLAYPGQATNFERDVLSRALLRLGLDRLEPRLDVTARWDHELNEQDRHLVVFARALVHRPDWLLIDDLLQTVDEEAKVRIADVLAHDLAHAGVIYLGGESAAERLGARVLHLVKNPNGRPLKRGRVGERKPEQPEHVAERV